MSVPEISQGAKATITLDASAHDAVEISSIPSLLLGPIAALAIWFAPLGMEPSAQKAMAVIAMMIVYWVAEPVEHAITALIGCYLFWALGIAKFSVAFSGFATSSPWFIFSGALIAEAATNTGVAKRLGYRVLCFVGTSYSRLLLGVTTLSFLITFLIPSGTARLTIVAAMLCGVITASEFARKGNVAKGLFLAVTSTCGLFDKMILAGAGSILTHGIVKEQLGIDILWSQWALAFLPIAVLSVPACWLTLIWLYPAHDAALPEGARYLEAALKEMGRVSAPEKKVLTVIGVAVILWSTDFLHHLDPTMIGLGAGFLLSLPKIGVLNRHAIKKINFLHSSICRRCH